MRGLNIYLFSSSLCAITYYLATHPEAQRKLHAELDEALGPCVCPNVDLKASVNELKADVAPYDAVKALPYLEACIQEGLRIHSTLWVGLWLVLPFDCVADLWVCVSLDVAGWDCRGLSLLVD